MMVTGLDSHSECDW